jgi:TPP-dependent 2-oxoacid decarboxylase
MKQSIGNFLLRRLDEVGIRHIFGVPGDYNLEFMQQLEDRGEPAWIGTCNELNGSYAADGYARIRGLSALAVTYGVGALSAINGIAGACSEHVPVVCICGSLPLRSLERSELMHHTLADGGRGNFYRMFAEVTAAQAELSPENAVVEVDRLILTAWRRKLPVYLELPSDIAYIEIDTPDEPLRLTPTPSSRERLEACAKAILARLNSAKSPALLLDLDADRFGVSRQVNRLAENLQMPVAVLNTCKAGFTETSPLFAGVYLGVASADATRQVVEKSDCLLTVGLRRIDSTSAFFSDAIPASAIHLKASSVNIGLNNYQAVSLPELLEVLIDRTQSASTRRTPIMSLPAAPSTPSQALLTQAHYWKALQKFLRPGDVIIAEDGTSNSGATEMRLPPGCSFITQAVWGSIGYSVGALLGTLCAAPERRHILFVGDGSFQLTAQELSTILRHDLKPYIFLINNRGYTIERAILGKNALYNDVANWRYTDLPAAFCPESKAECYTVATEEDLQRVLDAPHQGLVFVEALMDKDDSPVSLIRGGHAFADSDFGPTGPQFVPDANIPLPTP